ncbi:hypothetical protein IW148_006051 [Coemansia sp. RSA 1199]|nr:hypothetical protein IW148_006051 [Coemansia sp. RSA 1199]
MESPPWLVDYYSSVMDVVSPACGLSTAVASAVLVTMYKDTSSTVAVRVSGLLGLTDALSHICHLIARELSLKTPHTPTASARIFTFLIYFLQLVNIFLNNRIALDLQINFLGWFACSRFLRFVQRHYMRVSVCVALVLALPLLFAQAQFVYLYPQWTFGSTTRNIVFVVLSFYVWVGILLINSAIVIVAVVVKLRKRVPSASAEETLAAPAMRRIEQRMRRKARILVLYPLSAVVFIGPSLVFYWVQALWLERVRATQIVWMVTMVVGPVQAVYDFGVFVALPPVQRVVKWNCELHKETEGLFGARGEVAVAAMSNEEAWAQDVG